jgi:hypothetical protein
MKIGKKKGYTFCWVLEPLAAVGKTYHQRVYQRTLKEI